ncbi:MAG: low molecular weight phosphatase family protein [Pseudomonadota bacterium]
MARDGPSSSPAGARAVSDTWPTAVLFACSLNSVRSPMAAALLRHLVGRRFYVASGGVRAGEIDPFAVSVMNEIGIDISNHRPTSVEDLHDTSFDLVISLSPEAHHHALEFTRTMAIEAEYWATADATARTDFVSREMVLGQYRAVRDVLFRRIKQRFAISGGVSV